MLSNSHIMLRTGDLNCGCHVNSELEVIYVKKGSITVFYENKPLLLTDGEATVILPFSIHQFEANSRTDATVFMFSNSFAEEFCNEYSVNNSFENKFALSAETDAYIDRILSKESLDFVDAKALFYAFAAESPYINSQGSSKSEPLRRVVEWIYQRIDEPITLDIASSELCISKRSLTSLFKNRLDITFNDFLSSIRIEKAKNMLIKDEQSITEIAFVCGFGSVRSFNRVFQRFTGCTPSEYKKSLVRLC